MAASPGARACHGARVSWATPSRSRRRASSSPWHRVLNARGAISLPAGSKAHRTQRRLLEEEGIVFRKGRVDLGKSGAGLDLDALLWRPRRD